MVSQMIRYFLILCLGIFLTSCSDDNSAGSSIHYVEGNENVESRTLALQGKFSLNNKLIPVKIDIDVVDENLDSIATIKASLKKERNGTITFSSDYDDFASSIVRIKYTCAYNDSSSKLKMDFVEYINIDKNPRPTLNLPMALASERIKELVQEDGFYLARAKEKVLREIFELLDYNNKQIIDFEQDSSSKHLAELNQHVNMISTVEKSDSAFYKNYKSLRSAVGSEKTWQDILSETEIADMAFAHDPDIIYADYWTKAFGLGSCDSTHFQDTTIISNKESVYNKKKFLCDYKNKTYYWRTFNDVEAVNGLCTYDRKDTVIQDSLVWTCDSAKTKWNVMSGEQALPYQNISCDKILEGTYINYNSKNFACVYENNKFIWKDSVSENYKWRNSLDVYLKNKVGLCDEDNSLGRSTIMDNKYYQCRDGIWTEVDKISYYLGYCNKSRTNDKAMHDSVGYFICNDKWTEIPIPQYYGDICTKGFVHYAKKYGDTYYICKDQPNYYWSVALKEELSIPIQNDYFCEEENNGEVFELDGVGYKCVYPIWQYAQDFEVKVSKAMERNKYSKDMCKNGPANSSIFWDKIDSTFYGCVDSYTEANYGWGKVIWNNYNNPLTKFKSPEDFAGGTYDSLKNYKVNGWTLTFSYGGSSLSGSIEYITLYLKKAISPKGDEYDVLEGNNVTVIRAAAGNKTVSLDSITNKSDSFDKYFTDWKNKIIESTQCPTPTLPELKCVSNWDESDIEINFTNYNQNSYATWNQTKSFCPEGTHIPSAEELSISNYAASFNNERFTAVQQKMNNGKKGSFSANYSLVWTSTEKDSKTQYCLEYVKSNSNQVVASGIVECPKDLYPMVQVVCINDGRKP